MSAQGDAHLHWRPSGALVVRGEQVRALELELELGAKGGLSSARPGLRGFDALLAAEERRRLRRIFVDDPLVAHGGASLSPMARELRAHIYVSEVARFLEVTEARALDYLPWLDPRTPVGAQLLTWSGSRVLIGAPDTTGRRPFVYRPIRSRGLPPVRGRAPLEPGLLVGAPARIGDLTTSRVRFIVSDPELVDPDAQAPIPPGGSALTATDDGQIRRVLLEYECGRSLRALESGARRGMRDVELLALALLAQELATRRREAAALSRVAGFRTRDGSSYRVLRVDRHARIFDLRREPVGADASTFSCAAIEPQRLVTGAPLCLFGHDGHELVLATSPIVAVVMRPGDG